MSLWKVFSSRESVFWWEVSPTHASCDTFVSQNSGVCHVSCNDTSCLQNWMREAFKWECFFRTVSKPLNPPPPATVRNAKSQNSLKFDILHYVLKRALFKASLSQQSSTESGQPKCAKNRFLCQQHAGLWIAESSVVISSPPWQVLTNVCQLGCCRFWKPKHCTI